MSSKTPNLNLNLPNFNTSPWHDELNTNFRSIDAVIVSIFGLTTLLGPYKNSTAVSAGQRYFDENTSFYYEALSDFTTMAFPNTFAEERIAHPARWVPLDASRALDAAANALASEVAARASQVIAQASAASATTSASVATTSASTASTAATIASTAATSADASADRADASAAVALQAANDVTGTNATMLGGITSDNYARTDIPETFNNAITASGNISGNILIANGGAVQSRAVNSTGNAIYDLRDETGALMGLWSWFRTDDSLRFRNATAGNAFDLTGTATGTWTVGGNEIWHAGNDGVNSGLDADLLDGQQGVFYRNASNLNDGVISDARLPDTISSNITGNAATATNATQLGGQLATNYARTDISETFNNAITASGNISGNVFISNSGSVQSRAAATGNASYDVRDETGAQRGLWFWLRADNSLRFRNQTAGSAFDLTGNSNGGWSIGANPIWHAGNDVRHRSYTTTTRPAANVAGAGTIIYLTNAAGGAVPVFSDGTFWRNIGTQAIL